MNIILTEKVNNLGNLGDIVYVKPGYARNYLLPQGKAIRATKENIEIFEKERSKREEDNNKNKSEAEKLSKELKDISLIILRPASETGLLYGSVSTRDISKLLKEKNHSIAHKQIVLETKTNLYMSLNPSNMRSRQFLTMTDRRTIRFRVDPS